MTDISKRAEDLFHRVVALPVAERAARLDAERPDPAVRAEVESLLAHAERGAGLLSDAVSAQLTMVDEEHRQEHRLVPEGTPVPSDPPSPDDSFGESLLARLMGSMGAGVLIPELGGGGDDACPDDRGAPAAASFGNHRVVHIRVKDLQNASPITSLERLIEALHDLQVCCCLCHHRFYCSAVMS